MQRQVFISVLASLLFACVRPDVADDTEQNKRSPINQEWIDNLVEARADCEGHIKDSGVLLQVDAELEQFWGDIVAATQNADRRDTIYVTLGGNGGFIIIKPLHFKLATATTHFGIGFDGGKDEVYFRHPLEEAFRVEETSREGIRDYYRCEFGDDQKFLFEEVEAYEKFTKPVVPGTTRQITIGGRPLPTLVEARSPDGGYVIQHCVSDGGTDRQLCTSIIADASAIDQVVPKIESQSSMLEFRNWSTEYLDQARGK